MCDYSSRTEGRLKRHIADFHSEENERKEPGKPKSFKCRQCSFVATEKLEYWSHARTHIKPDKILECPQCPFVTEYKHHLEYHLRNHYKSKPFSCEKCNYRCVNKSMLNSHMKSHTNVYQYRCAECSYATKYCHSLKLHLKKYNHTPAPVLNADGSLPQDGSGDFESMSKRGPPKGPRGPRGSLENQLGTGNNAMPMMFGGNQPHLGMNGSLMHPGINGGFPMHPSINSGGPMHGAAMLPTGFMQMFPMGPPPPLTPISQLNQLNQSENEDDYDTPTKNEKGPWNLPNGNGNGNVHPHLPSPFIPSPQQQRDSASPVNENGGDCALDLTQSSVKRKLYASSESSNSSIISPPLMEEGEEDSISPPPGANKAWSAMQNEGSMFPTPIKSPNDSISPPPKQSTSSYAAAALALPKKSRRKSTAPRKAESRRETFKLDALWEKQNAGEIMPSDIDDDDVSCEVTPNSSKDKKFFEGQDEEEMMRHAYTPKVTENGEHEQMKEKNSAEAEVKQEKAEEKKTYTCQHCETTFTDCTLHALHMGFHSNRNPFECNKCGQKCADKIQFFLHLVHIAHQ